MVHSQEFYPVDDNCDYGTLQAETCNNQVEHQIILGSKAPSRRPELMTLETKADTGNKKAFA